MDSRLKDYLIICFSGLMVMLSSNLAGPILPLYAKTFTSELVLVGAVISGYAMIRFLVEIPWGLVSDAVGRKRPIVLGMILCMISAVICYTASNVYQLIIARAIWGVGSAAYFCVTMALITDITPTQYKGKALGTFQGIEFIGSTVGASLSGVLTTYLGGYRQLFAVSAGLTGIPVILLLFTNLDQYSTSKNPEAIKLIKESMAQWRLLLSSTVIASGYAAFAFALNYSGLMSTIIPLYVVDVLGYSIINLSVFMGARSVGTALGTIAGGWLYDRYGGTRVLIAGFSVAAASILSIATLTRYELLIAALNLSGVAFGLIYSTLPNIVAKSVPVNMKGAAIGSYRTFMDLGVLGGPLILTAIATSTGLRFPFYLMTLWLIASMAVSTLLIRHKNRA